MSVYGPIIEEDGMRKVVEVYLCTNRNVLAFDEKGEQIVEIQKAISWQAELDGEYEALQRIIRDQPKVYICSYGKGWAHEIRMEEFCSLLGHGPWYWERWKRKDEDEEISALLQSTAEGSEAAGETDAGASTEAGMGYCWRAGNGEERVS